MSARIFLCYAEKDQALVQGLHGRLQKAGFIPFMAHRDVLPGEKTELSVREAVKKSDFFLACMSSHTTDLRGPLQREIGYALDLLQDLLESDIFLIPTLLSDCELPERLRDFQPVRLYEKEGWRRLMKAFEVGMGRRAVEKPEQHIPENHAIPAPDSPFDPMAKVGEFFARFREATVNLHQGNLRNVSYYIQQNLIYLLKAAGGGDTGSELLKSRLNNPAVNLLIRLVVHRCNLTGHDLNDSLNRKRASDLYTHFLAVYFWFHKNILPEIDPGFAQFKSSLTIVDFVGSGENLERNGFDYSALNEILPGAEKFKEIYTNRTIAMHRFVLENLPPLEEWQKILLNLAIFRVNGKFEIPYAVVKKSPGKPALLGITVLEAVTVIFAPLGDAFIIVYMGDKITPEEWRGEHKILSNGRDYLDIIKSDVVPGQLEETLRKHIYEPGPSYIAPEVEERIMGAVDESTGEGYAEYLRSVSGFAQSNIALLNDDQDLRLALKFPLDSWRLFLHPLQIKIVRSSEQIVFIKGGPGTGKTIVLAHRIAYMVRKRRTQGRKFKIVFLSFTPSIARNMTQMLEQLDISLREEIFIADIREFFTGRSKGELGIGSHFRSLIFWEKKGEARENFLLTDLFFDEFQDFPTSEEGNYIVNLLRRASVAGTGISCTYDENQSILHSQTDLDFWDKYLDIHHYRLSYCYRMAREIHEISINHRKIMLRHAEDMVRISTGTSISYKQLQAKPTYALTGGKLELYPAYNYKQTRIAKFLLKQLAKRYKPDEFIVIFFEDKTPKARDIVLKFEEWHDEIRREFGIGVYNPQAVKGLEFKAGVVLFAHLCFEKYHRYLKEGVHLRRVSEYCRMLISIAARQLLPELETLFYQDEGKEMYLEFLALVDKGPGFLRPQPGYRDFLIKEIESLNIPRRFYKDTHIRYMEAGDSRLRQQLGNLRVNLSKSYKEIRPEQLRIFLENLLRDLNRIMKHADAGRNKLINEDIDRSLRDLNEFYVGITRFRDLTYVVYDREFELEDVIPGAELVKHLQRD